MNSPFTKIFLLAVIYSLGWISHSIVSTKNQGLSPHKKEHDKAAKKSSRHLAESGASSLARIKNKRNLSIDQKSTDSGIIALGELLQNTDLGDAHEQLLNQKSKMDQKDFEFYEQEILFNWAIADPEAADNITGIITSQASKDSLLRGLAKGWAEKDISEAFNWLQTQDSNSASDTLMVECYHTIMSKYSADDPVNAAKAIAQIDSPHIQSLLMESIVEGYSKHHFTGAVDWLLTLDNEVSRNIGISQIADELKNNDPDKFLGSIIDNQQILSDHTLSSALERVSSDHPSLVAKTLYELLPANQANITQSVLSNWLSKDQESAMTWFSQQPNGVVYQAGLEIVAKRLSKLKPENGLIWANLIDDESTRYNSIERIVTNAKTVHLANISNEVHNLNLSNSEKDALLKLAKDRVEQFNPATLVIPE